MESFHHLFSLSYQRDLISGSSQTCIYVKCIRIPSCSGPHSVQMLENRDPNNSEYRHFSRSALQQHFFLAIGRILLKYLEVFRTQSSICDGAFPQLLKCTASAKFSDIHPKLCGNRALPKKLYIRKLGEMSVFTQCRMITVYSRLHVRL